METPLRNVECTETIAQSGGKRGSMHYDLIAQIKDQAIALAKG